MVKMMLLGKGVAVSRFSRRKGTINTIFHNISSDDKKENKTEVTSVKLVVFKWEKLFDILT